MIVRRKKPATHRIKISNVGKYYTLHLDNLFKPLLNINVCYTQMIYSVI